MINRFKLTFAITLFISSISINLAIAQTPPSSPAAKALSADLIKQVNESIDADSARLIAMYKDLHQHPELGFTEVRTAAIVAKELKQLGFDVTEGVGKTGVVGVLKNGAGPTIWFRADMDANAVAEITGLPYAAKEKQRLADGSEIDVMHACGHDAHVTWMLGMANTMVKLKQQWSGTLVVYAQPAEELGTGAQTMVEDGVWLKGFPKPDYAFGAHTVPVAVGLIGSGAGVRMAGTDQLDITFHGVGGHGSTPQMTIDPVVMAAQAVMAYQTIISRDLDPQAAAVLTVGAIAAGRDNNVIPESSLLKLNLRWFSHDVREKIITRIDEINKGIALSAGMTADQMPTRVMKGNAGPLVNNESLISKINPSLELLLGKENVFDKFPSLMGSEDFQEIFKGHDVPYAYVFIGVAPPKLFAEARKAGKDAPYSNHNPNFFVDLDAIPLGAKVDTVMVLSGFNLH